MIVIDRAIVQRLVDAHVLTNAPLLDTPLVPLFRGDPEPTADGDGGGTGGDAIAAWVRVMPVEIRRSPRQKTTSEPDRAELTVSLQVGVSIQTQDQSNLAIAAAMAGAASLVDSLHLSDSITDHWVSLGPCEEHDLGEGGGDGEQRLFAAGLVQASGTVARGSGVALEPHP